MANKKTTEPTISERLEKHWWQKNSLEKILKLHIVDTTGGVTAGMPTWALYETFAMGFGRDYSIANRIFGVASSYLILGKLFAWGRDLSQKTFRLSSDSRYIGIHDMAYGFAFTMATSPAFYRVTEWFIGKPESTEYSPLLAALFSIPMGWVGGKAIDKYRKMCGISYDKKTGLIYNESEREELEKLNGKIKPKTELTDYSAGNENDNRHMHLDYDITQQGCILRVAEESLASGTSLETVSAVATAQLEEGEPVLTEPVLTKSLPPKSKSKYRPLPEFDTSGYGRTRAATLAIGSAALTAAYYWLMQ